MSGDATPPQPLLPLLLAYDEALAAGREPALTAPPELGDEFGAAQSVLRLLHQAWPRPQPGDATVDQSGPPAAAADAQPAPRARLGRFEVLRELGRGGFGVVYLAYDPTLARHVALKALRPERGDAPEFRRRFLQEGRAAAKLDHPNVVRVLEAGEADSDGYIASAYCDGPSLAALLRGRVQPLPCRLAAALAADLAAGAHHAHERGVVHRDIKPGNILLEVGAEAGPDGLPRRITPKLCDFGLAKLAEADQTETRAGVVMGTPQYMAPEQAEGRSREVGPASDVYALGVVLYELLTGRPPFEGEPGLDLLRRIATAPPERPRRRRKDVPRDLEAIVLTCLEKEPGRRYASAAALEADLRRWLDGKPPLGRPEPWRRRVGRWVRRRPAWTAAAALVLLLAVVGWAAWPYLHPDPDRVAKEEMAQVARGQAVTLVGEKGGPTNWRWRGGGEKSQMEVTPDGAFRVNTGGVCLLELLPDPGRDHYRFRAEIQHEWAFNSGETGLYFGHREYPASRGSVHTFLDVAFDETRAPKDYFPPGTKAPLVVPQLNPVFVEASVWSPPDWGLGIDGANPVRGERLFQAAGNMRDLWRTLTVEVTQQGVRASWGNGAAVGAPVSAGEATSSWGLLLGGMGQEARRDAPALFAAPPGFTPRGGLGLYLRYGRALFRNVVVEPLD